jgi:poly(A) polymerase
LQDAIDDVFSARIGDVSGGGKLASDMRDTWLMQPRFEKRVGTSPFGMVEQPRFRAAFDFMRLRAENGEVEEVLADWWQDFSMANDTLRQDMVDQVREEQAVRQRAPRPAKAAPQRDPAAPVTPAASAEAESRSSGASSDEAPADGSTVSDAPKKRRRRRRSAGSRPSGGEDASPPG